MVFTTPWSLTTFWIMTALGLWVILLIVGAGIYSPTLRNQIKALEQQGADSAQFKMLNQRGTTVGLALAVIVMVIIFLMVFKPNPFA